MIKMLVVLDEEKIIREGEYSLDKIKEFIVKVFEKCEITKCDADGWFLSQNDKFDYGNFMRVIECFLHNEGVFENLKEWIWVVKDRRNDLLNDFRKKRLSKGV